jgi:hypothetical protein
MANDKTETKKPAKKLTFPRTVTVASTLDGGHREIGRFFDRSATPVEVNEVEYGKLKNNPYLIVIDGNVSVSSIKGEIPGYCPQCPHCTATKPRSLSEFKGTPGKLRSLTDETLASMNQNARPGESATDETVEANGGVVPE